jgi:hypothetical protein
VLERGAQKNAQHPRLCQNVRESLSLDSLPSLISARLNIQQTAGVTTVPSQIPGESANAGDTRGMLTNSV